MPCTEVYDLFFDLEQKLGENWSDNESSTCDSGSEEDETSDCFEDVDASEFESAPVNENLALEPKIQKRKNNAKKTARKKRKVQPQTVNRLTRAKTRNP